MQKSRNDETVEFYFFRFQQHCSFQPTRLGKFCGSSVLKIRVLG